MAFLKSSQRLKNLWSNTKVVLITLLYTIISKVVYLLVISPVFNKSLFSVFALTILFVVVLRKYIMYLTVFFLTRSYRRATSIITLKWLVPLVTVMWFSLPGFARLIMDVWITEHPNWAKVTIIVMFSSLIITCSYCIINLSKFSYEAKLALRNGLNKFVLSGKEYEVVMYTDN